MRNHLIAEVERMAEVDPSIVVLTADLGYGVLGTFASKFPDRFFNVGISEQNMTSMATGLALEGYTVFTYSIGNFPVMRCLEQIRNNVCYHEANVKIVAVGGGFAYGPAGMTHHATEDIAIMRALPNMRVFSPADASESVQVVRAARAMAGPCYIRLARGGEPDIHPDLIDVDIKKPFELRKGNRVAVFATGPVLGEVLKAGDMLKKQGMEIGVVDCVTLKPFDSLAFAAIAQRYETIVSVEEHNVVGGLGSILADGIAGKGGKMPRLVKLGLQDVYTSVVGDVGYLRRCYGISCDGIAETVKRVWNC